MNIHLDCQEDLARACHDIVRVFYPETNFTAAPAGADFSICLKPGPDQELVVVEGVLSVPRERENRLFSTADYQYPGEARHNAQKRVAKLVVKGLLERYTGAEAGPWGILTGIRPTKIVHRLLGQGWSGERVESYLQSSFALSREKSRLLREVAELQLPFLQAGEVAGKYISIYIGIPFCPTRCVYCSFPAYSLERHRAWVEPFVSALLEEIRGVGRVLQELGLEVETIYIGGGTPTSLPVGSLAQLLHGVDAWLKTQGTREYTVEAGRPDTLNGEVLELLRSHGVSRLSINPQSMNPQTLKAIGRAHSPEELIRAMETARSLGFANINMDLIIGLPGEGLAEISKTLEAIKVLAPENITVHTLAIKRASALKEQPGMYALAGSGEAAEMLNLTYRNAREAGMRPYYLYRQKQMLGHLENVGFAKAGYECIYNIQMIEERQTIVGLGGGSGSKWVNPADWSLEATYNPKDPRSYFERVEELTRRKVEKLQAQTSR